MRKKTRSVLRGGALVAIVAAASATLLSGPANAATAVKVPPRMTNKAATMHHTVNPLSKRVQGASAHN